MIILTRDGDGTACLTTPPLTFLKRCRYSAVRLIESIRPEADTSVISLPMTRKAAVRDSGLLKKPLTNEGLTDPVTV